MKRILLGVIALLSALPLLGGEPSPKALKYHKILRKRPSSGYVFDRFYDSWLDSATSAELESFLTKKSKAGNANDKLLLAYYYLRQGKEIDALKLYQKALKLTPNNTALLLQKAKLEARLLNFDAALQDLKAALPKANEEQKLDILNLQGRYLARSGQPAAAAKLWKSLLAAQPDNKELIDSILEVQLSEGLFEEALATSALQIKKTRDPYQKVINTLRRGDIYQRAGKRKKAIDMYVSTLDQVGQDSWLEREILAQLREIYRREDDMEGLNKLYTDLSIKHPQRIGIQKAHAHLLATIGREEDAVALFRNILKVTPGNRKNREELISILLKTNKLNEALTEIKQLAKENPKNAAIQLKLASVLHRVKDKKSLPAALYQYQKLKNNTETARLLVASLFDKYKLPDEAEKSLRSTVKAFPESMEALGSLAQFLHNHGKAPEALTIWKTMIAKGNRETVIRQSRQLKLIGKDKLAYQLLQSRSKDFKTDLPFLNFLTQFAIDQKDFTHAAQWAMNVLKLSKHTEEIRLAIKLNTQIAHKADTKKNLTDALAAKKNRSAVESWLLAELYELQGQSENAVATLKSLRQQDPQIAAIAEVALYEYRGDWANAAKATLRMIAQPKGKKPSNLRRLIEFYERLGQPELALKHIETWKQIAPGDKNPWFKQADLLTSMGDLDKAIQTLRRAAQRFETDSSFRARLASLYQTNGQYASAERLYWRLYEDATTLNERLRWIPKLAEVSEAQGRSKDLINRFLEKRKNNRKSVEPLLALAEIYRFNESYEERRKFMMEAARLRPNDPEILFAIANIEEREGDIQRAETTLRQAAELDKSEKSQHALAQFYLRNDEVDKGIEIIKSLSSGKHANPRDLEKATMSIASLDREEALKFLDSALASYPDDYRLSYLKAILLSQEERFDEALTQLIATLDMNRDLKAVKPVMTQKAWNQMFEQAGGIFPRSQMHLLFDFYAVRAFSSNSGRHSRRRGAPAYMLPGSLFEKKPLVIGGILYLYTKLDEAKRQQALPLITAAGIVDVEYRILIISNQQNRGNNDTSALKKYAKAHPDRVDAIYFPTMMEIMNFVFSRLYRSSNEQQLDSDFLKFALTHGDKIPATMRFSIEMTLLLAQNGKKATAKQWNHALDLVKNLKKDAIRSCSPFLALAMMDSENLPPEVEKSILDLATTWYWQDATSAQNPYIASGNLLLGQMILSHYIKNNDKEALLSFLDKICDASAKQKKPSAQQPFGPQIFGRNQGAKFKLPAFPPQQASPLPFLVSNLLKKKSEQDNTGGFLGPQSPFKVDIAPLKLNTLLDKVKNPYLRIHIANFYDDNKALEAALKALASAEQPTLTDIYYQAGFLVKQDKLAEASALLAHARFLPMKRAQRKELDKQLTALALAILTADGEKKHPEAILQGRRAALRLRQSVTPSERRILISALDELGLQKEADLVAAKATPSTGFPYSGSSGNSQDEIKKIKAAIVAKNPEKAQRLMLRAIRFNLNRPYDYSSKRTAEKLRDIIHKNPSLLPFLKKKMKPTDASSVRRMVNYALMLHFLGEDKEALALLDKLAKKGFKDNNALLTYSFLLPPSRRDDAVTSLRKFIKNTSQNQRHSNALDSKFDELEEAGIKPWLDGYDLLAHYVATLPAPTKKSPSQAWIMQIASELVTNNYVKQTHFPALGSKENLKKIKEDDSHGYYKRRLKIARSLLKNCLAQPELAAWAFPLYHASFIGMNEEDKLDPALAITALKSSLTTSKSSNSQTANAQAMIMMRFSMMSSNSQTIGKSPLQYIASQAWKKKNKSIFPAGFLAEIKKKNKAAVRPLEVLQSTLFLKQDQLEKAIASQLSADSKKESKQSSAHILAEICLIRQHLSPAMESWMTSKVPTKDMLQWRRRLNALNSTVPNYAKIILEKEPQRLSPFLLKLATAIIQPDGDIKKFCKSANTLSYTVNPNDKAFRIDALTSLFNSTAFLSSSTPAILVHVARTLQSCGLSDEMRYGNFYYNLDSTAFSNIDSTLKFFDTARFGKMSTPEELIPITNNEDKLNVFTKLVERLSQRIRPKKNRRFLSTQDIIKRLPSLSSEQQFIFRLALALYASKKQDKQKTLLALLEHHPHPLNDWKPDMIQWFSSKVIIPALFDSKKNAIVIPENFTPSAKKQLGRLLKNLNANIVKRLDTIIKLKKFKSKEELKQTRAFFKTNLNSLLSQDRPKLIKAIGHAASLCRLFEMNNPDKKPTVIMSMNEYAYSSNTYSTFYSVILNQYPDTNNDIIPFIYAIRKAETSPAPPLSLKVIILAAKKTHKIYYSILKGREKSLQSKLKSLTKLVSNYEKLPAEQQPLAALCLVHLTLNNLNFSLANCLKSTKHFEDLNTKHPSLIKTALSAGILANLVDWKNRQFGAHAATLTRKLYQALPAPEHRILLSHLLAIEGGELFCDDAIQEMATRAIASKIDTMNAQEKLFAYFTLHCITFQKASTKNKQLYLELYQKLKKDLNKAARNSSSHTYYSGSKKFSEKSNFKYIEQALLGLALRSGDEDALRHVMLRYKSKLIGNPYAVCLALRYNKPDIAHTLWRGKKFKVDRYNYKYHVPSPINSPLGLMDSNMEKSLAAFIKLAPNDVDRQLLRDTYLVRSSTFAPGLTPSQNFFERSKKLVTQYLPKAKYGVNSANKFYFLLMTNNQLPAKQKKEIKKHLLKTSPRFMKELLVLKSYNLIKNWDQNNFYIIALYFEKLVNDDNLEEFTRVLNKMVATERASGNRSRVLNPYYLPSAALQTKLFAAIDAGDKQKILHIRKYLDPLASTFITYHYCCRDNEGALAVALHALCYAYSDKPSEYQDYFKQQVKIQPRLKHFHWFVDFLAFVPLTHATYKGSPFNSEKNEQFQLKVFKKVIEAVQAGLFQDRKYSYVKWALSKEKIVTPKVYKKLTAIIQKYSPNIGKWTPQVIGSTSKNPKILTLDITKRIKGDGEYTVTFSYTRGNYRLDIDFVEVLRNGKKSIGKDTHHGWTGQKHHLNTYKFKVTDYKPGQKYILKAQVYGDLGNNSYGTIILKKCVAQKSSNINGWNPQVIGSTSKNPKILTLDITKRIKGDGEYTVTFSYTRGNYRLDIDFVEVLRNGKKSIGKDTHHGWTGRKHHLNTYKFKVTDYKPGQKYILKAQVYGDLGNNSYGTIILKKSK